MMPIMQAYQRESKKDLVARFGLTVLLFVLPLGGWGCQRQEADAKKERVLNVKVWTAEAQSVRPYIDAVGELKAYETVIVSSEVDGLLRRVLAEEGAAVSRGSLLASINETDYRLEVSRAEAAVRQAEASSANIRQEFQRKEALFKEELITRQQYDDVNARRLLAEGDLDRARIALSLAGERLRKTRVYAPLSGSVKEKRVTAGDYVRNGTPLYVLIQTNPLKLLFNVPEKEVGSLRMGQDLQFTVDAFPGRTFRGTVRTIYPHVEERTRTLRVEGVVPNPDGALKPGLFTKVTLYSGPARLQVVVPVTSILYEGQKTKVFHVEGDRARERFVRVGRKYGEMMEVLEGLKAGEQLVVVGQNNLTEGMKVHVAR